MDSNLTEDKTCRICGFADIKNYSLLDRRYKTLYQKILTVFPLVIYESDPLPKNICHKCLANVTVAYDSVQRVLRTQKQWISNVRNFQPNNKYVKVLELVEKTSEKLSEEIQKLTNEQVGVIFPFRLMKTDESHENNKQVLQSTVTIKKEIEQNGNYVPTTTVASPQQKSQRLEEIQNILASKGCTLLSLKDKQNLTRPSTHVPRLKVSRAVACTQCGQRFPGIKALALHQVSHMKLETHNLFEKRPLEKKVRRGRLIVIQDKKCIRCLNCWRLFYDNKSILDHWSDSKCEYFCIVCGKEFPTSPRMLREHMPAAHGITFKSTKKLMSRIPPRSLSPSLMEVKQEPVEPDDLPPLVPISTPRNSLQGPIIVKHTSPNTNPERDIRLEIKVKCNLCNKVFANFKAKNSHMRAHKSKEAEEFMSPQRMIVKKEPVEVNPLMPTVQTGDYIPPSIVPRKIPVPVKLENTVKFLKVKSISKFPEFMQPLPVSSSVSFRLPFICQICDIKFECGEDLLYHLTQCEESVNSYICMECYKQFQTPAEVQLHIQLDHQAIH